jgi:hypothetical protein
MILLCPTEFILSLVKVDGGLVQSVLELVQSFNLNHFAVKMFSFCTASNLRKFASFSDIASVFVGQWSHHPLTLATLLEEIATCGALYSFLCSCYQRSGD